MPNRIETNARQILGDEFVRCLTTVRQASGYNTDPMVTDDPDVVVNSDDKQHILFVHTDDEEVQERRSGLSFKMAIQFIVVGYAHKGTTSIRMETNKLLQDTRTALSNNLAQFSSLAGRSIDFEMDSVSVDEGGTLPDGWGGFVLPIVLHYFGGKDW